MDLYMSHGRLNPNGTGSDIYGVEIDDWGFEGPRLHGVIGFHCTYGLDGTFAVYFESAEACEAAQALTGWDWWDDRALLLQTEEDCVRIYNNERKRFEYFGDWGMK
jgi:hypothetical protein